MFRDTLIESSSTGRKRQGWPMTLAFILEALVGAALIALPLLSTGVIPVSARIACPIATLGRTHATQAATGHRSSGGVTLLHPVTLHPIDICFSCKRIDTPESGKDNDSLPPTFGIEGAPNLPDPSPTRVVPQQEPPKRIRVSTIEEGQLMNKVEPVYPRIALISGVKGDVRLHAVIARDGTIQSLAVVSGHPMLVEAARSAVSQWRYRPYLLNGEPVEVETFITVSFK